MMTPLYSTNALASAVYTLVVSLWVVSELAVFVRTIGSVGVRAHVASNRRQDRLSGPVLIFGISLAIAVGSSLAHRFPGTAVTFARPQLFAVGAVIAILGIALRWYAIITLGRFFSMRVQTTADQQVVESGPYRLVRHPSYTGAMLTIAGVLMMSTSWLALACFTIALPGFAYRIAVEEQVLASGIGAPYRDYMRRSKRLIPFLV